jgi:hypothetical protein
VFGKLARWKNRYLSLIGKSVIVSSQLLPIIMFTGSVISMPASMNQELSRGIYRFIWNVNDKEKNPLTYQKLKNGGLVFVHLYVHTTQHRLHGLGDTKLLLCSPSSSCLLPSSPWD